MVVYGLRTRSAGSDALSLQGLPPRQRPPKGRVHLHVPQLGDGEVQVLEGLGAIASRAPGDWG